MHSLDEFLDMARRSRRHDPMPEVEDMPCRVAEVREGALGLALHRVRVREQHQRVEIALQGDLPADARARLPEAHGPVDPDRIAAARRDLLEPGATALGEHDAWHPLTG